MSAMNEMPSARMEKKRLKEIFLRSSFSCGRMLRSGALIVSAKRKMQAASAPTISMPSVKACAAVMFMARKGPMAEAIVTPSVK